MHDAEPAWVRWGAGVWTQRAESDGAGNIGAGIRIQSEQERRPTPVPSEDEDEEMPEDQKRHIRRFARKGRRPVAGGDTGSTVSANAPG
jgi:hypothetical protein